MDMHKDVDRRVFKSILVSDDFSKYFVATPNALRSKVTINACEIARNFLVHNCFAWRVARYTHCDDDNFSELLKTFYRK